MITPLAMHHVAERELSKAHPFHQSHARSIREKVKKWKTFFGCSPVVAADIWNRVVAKGVMNRYPNAQPYHLLYALLLAMKYATDNVHAQMVGCHVDTFRLWAWRLMQEVHDLHVDVVSDYN